MCPATGSIGSTSPRYRFAARASTMTSPAPSATSLGADRRHRARPHGDRTGGRRRFVTLDHGQSGGAPGLESAVQHPDIAQPRPAQQPPRPGGRRRVGPVVDHHRRVIVDTDRTPEPLQVIGIGQRVPTPGPGVPASCGVQVDEPCAGEVSGAVGLAIRTGQRPADVQQHRGAAARGAIHQRLRQHRWIDQREYGPFGSCCTGGRGHAAILPATGVGRYDRPVVWPMRPQPRVPASATGRRRR